MSNITHAIDCVLAAIQFLSYIRSEKNLLKCSIRIGIHSGPVMGGVVEDWKYTYDIWGDSVNIASRMESSGLPDKINISERTYELVKDFFQCDFRCSGATFFSRARPCGSFPGQLLPDAR